MKVYFSGSRHYLKQYGSVYESIAKTVVGFGFELVDMTKAFGNVSFGIGEAEKTDAYNFFLKSLNSADLSIFESSYPSTIHLGHEITLAMQKGKPVIILYKYDKDQKFEPLVLRGMDSDKVIWVAYTEEDLVKKLKEALIKAKEMQDVRFNFFVSPKILEYLDFVAKKRMIPRSVFLRDLIEREMKKDKEYLKD